MKACENSIESHYVFATCVTNYTLVTPITFHQQNFINII